MLTDLKNDSCFFGILYYMQYHWHSIITLWYIYYTLYYFIMDGFGNGKRNTPKLKAFVGRKQKQDSEVRKL